MQQKPKQVVALLMIALPLQELVVAGLSALLALAHGQCLMQRLVTVVAAQLPLPLLAPAPGAPVAVAPFLAAMAVSATVSV